MQSSCGNKFKTANQYLQITRTVWKMEWNVDHAEEEKECRRDGYAVVHANAKSKKHSKSIGTGTKQKSLLLLPNELLIEIFQFLPIRSLAHLSRTCKPLKLLHDSIIIPTIKKYSLKEQNNDIGSVGYILTTHARLEALLVEHVSKSANVTDEHMKPLINKPRTEISYLVIKGCVQLTKETFQLISNNCSNLIVLGKVTLSASHLLHFPFHRFISNEYFIC